MLVLHSLLALAAASAPVLAHSHHDSHGRPHAGISFGPNVSRGSVREFGAHVAGLADVVDKEVVSQVTLTALMPITLREATRIAKTYALDKLKSSFASVAGGPTSDILVTDSYTSDHNGVTHVYFVQTVDGIEVTNAVGNANVDQYGRILSFSSSFYEGKSAGPRRTPDTPRSSTSGPDALLFRQQISGSRLGPRHHKERKHGSKGRHHEHKGNKDGEHHHHEGKHHHHHHHHHDDDEDKKMMMADAEAEAAPVSAFLQDTTKMISPDAALLSFSKFLSMGIDKAHVVRTEPFDSGLLPSSRTDPDFTIHLETVSSLTDGPKHMPESVPAKFKYIQTEDGDLKAVWDLQVDLYDNYFNAHVDAMDGKVLSLIDWVSDASYNVYPLGINDPAVGDRVTVVDPAHPLASPHGWHWQSSATGKSANNTVTMGNNVYAHENLDGKNEWKKKIRPDGKAELNFDFPIDLVNQQPSEYLDAAVTNLFYWNNVIHDLFYVYGFTEKAGNFQDDNLDRGGKGNDAVIANAQDGSGYNNANFATPPDGGNGRMRMYVWDVTDPMRDGDLSGDIIQHEYAHGLSIRLTGGPANSACLGWGEAGGMGEGWGDFIATITGTNASTTRDNDFGIGTYANGGNGIRKFKYSTSIKTNPSTYSLVQKPAYWGVHAKGEVWAEILYEVYWNVVDVLGFNPDWFDTPLVDDEESTYRDLRTGARVPKTFKAPSGASWTRGGNVLMMQILLDGMKLQPCYPNFVDARDAIVLAESILTKGEYGCLIWKGFAKRGLGAKAKAPGIEDFSLPAKCRDDDDGVEAL
ncbi:Fungalysin/Thermolysin Extracellular metalloproteinase 5 [Phlyctochytrium planicorne]|nr:Fungalysin/Thermolysin Extracellular metalloproteinase 5 [Phlyctochytrium planicorne]